jgi:predicted nuclease of predicted toxin-antitoxin system
MRLIFDEDLPRDLPAHFESHGHETVHVEELGWKGIRNGDLLARIAGEYDVLVTGDTNMRFQQDLSRVDVAVVVLQPRRKVLEGLVALVPKALRAIETAPRGQAIIVQPD